MKPTYIRELTPNAKTGILAEFKSFFLARRRNEAYYISLKSVLKAYREGKSRCGFGQLVYIAALYVFGEKISGYFCRYVLQRKKGYIGAYGSIPKVLYHYLPSKFESDVRKNGLYKKRNVIFLTDKTSHIEKSGYFQMKTNEFGETTAFLRLEIDAERLSEKHSLLWAGANEYVVCAVEPDFITNI